MSFPTIQIAKHFQKSELTEHIVYSDLAKREKNLHNKKILEQIAQDEKKHYEFWKKISGEEIFPSKGKIWKYKLMARLLGLTFTIKLMEHGEAQAQLSYDHFVGKIANIEQIIQDEQDHEAKLIGVLKEKRLEYMGSIVLGLNDALVELTGVLAGLTLALQNMELIALSGLVTGIAASFSMGASEYLSKKADGEEATAWHASLYTWIAYFTTVVLLILPYLFLKNPFIALGCALTIAILIIAGFNFYISVAKGLNFKKRFLEMAGLSMSVAGLSFVIGRVLKAVFGVEV